MLRLLQGAATEKAGNGQHSTYMKKKEATSGTWETGMERCYWDGLLQLHSGEGRLLLFCLIELLAKYAYVCNWDCSILGTCSFCGT